MDLTTFLQELLHYRITLLEIFISKYVWVNPKYKDLFHEFLYLDGPLFNHNPKALIRELYEKANWDWNYYNVQKDDSSCNVKDFLHGYRKILLARNMLANECYSNSIQLSDEQKEKLKRIKQEHCVPLDLMTEYQEIEKEVKNALYLMPEEEQMPTDFLDFLRKAYRRYNSN